MKIRILILSFLILSCNKKDLKPKPSEITKKELHPNFRKIILDYQTRFPIPDTNNVQSRKGNIYIYYVGFHNDKNDTILYLTRSAAGIYEKQDKFTFGVYEDSDLKPLVITDSTNLSRNVILIKKNKFNKKYIWQSKSFPESISPLYTYILKNKEFKLKAIDTIWKRWD